MGWNVFRTSMVALAVTAVALGLGACGVKSSPRFPEGTIYPREYPYAGPKQGASAPAPASSSSEAPDKTRESDQGQRSPLGYPLEYPNRSSYK